MSMAAAAAALADVLITEFLISNISQKRGEGGNESGREERRGLYPMGGEGGMEGMASSPPPAKDNAKARSYPIFIFRSIEEGGKRAQRREVTQPHARL